MRPALTEHSPETSRKYAAAFGAWCRWAIGTHRPALPARANDVSEYLLHLAERGYALVTIKQVYWALAAMHRRSGHPKPDVTATWVELSKRARARERRDVTRKHAVQLRVTAVEFEQLKVEAKAAGCSVGRLLRQRVLEVVPPTTA